MNDDEKVCPRCAETIKKAALICRYCRHEFDPDNEPVDIAPDAAAMPEIANAASPGDGGSTADTIGKIVVGGIGLVVAIALIAQCTAQPTQSPVSAAENFESAAENLEMAADQALKDAEEAVAETQPASGWDVSTRMDEVRGEPIHFASLTSTNEVNFDFPYAGGSRLTMTVRLHPEYGEDVMFQISDGQFVCGIDDCSGMINIDGKAEPLSLSEPSDHDSKTLFASYGESIIDRVKGSKQVIVELPFYQEGNRQFTFKTDGLVWPPKS